VPESNNIDNKICVDIDIIHAQCALFTLYFATTLRIIWGSRFWLFDDCNCMYNDKKLNLRGCVHYKAQCCSLYKMNCGCSSVLFAFVGNMREN